MTLPCTDILAGLARNPALPTSLLDRLVSSAGPELSRVLSSRPDLTAAQSSLLAGRFSPDRVGTDCEHGTLHPDVRRAADPDTSPVALFCMTTHPEHAVRRTLAARTDLPHKAFERLAEDAVPGVRLIVALNPSAPPGLRRSLASALHLPADHYPHIARHPDLPVGLITDLLNDPEAAAHAAANPSLPVHAMEELLTPAAA